METINFKDIYIKGELAVRSGLNFTRLEGDYYRPDEVFSADKHGWAGDWEGRIILALTLLSQSTHRTPAYLDEIISFIPENLNNKGYFGNILPEGQFDEQQLAGHSWLLRALIEYYKIKTNDSVKNIIESIVRNLLLPAKGCYYKYPIESELRTQKHETWILSKLQTKTEHHAETSDGGCAFIMLDGATAAYEFLRWPELKELIEEMISRFMEMDFVKLHVQTHATLSAIRGIFRFYEMTGEIKYLDMVSKMFDLYKTEAWSESYGNFNWFGLPRWTEPCAIIDSFIITVSLWKATGNSLYLEDSHHIYFNAICHGHRITGGFGTDKCVGAINIEENLNLAPITFDVFWCCNMRGGEGFSRAIEYNFFSEDDNIFVPFYNNCTATLRFNDGILRLEEKTQYPYYGAVSFTVLENTTNTYKKMNLFAPSWFNHEKTQILINGNPTNFTFVNGFITFTVLLKASDKVEFDSELKLSVKETEAKNVVKGYHKYFYGPMLLGYKLKSLNNSEAKKMDLNTVEDLNTSKYKATGEINLARDVCFVREGRSEFSVEGTEIVLSSQCDVKNLTRENSVRQVLFQGRI